MSQEHKENKIKDQFIQWQIIAIKLEMKHYLKNAT